MVEFSVKQAVLTLVDLALARAEHQHVLEPSEYLKHSENQRRAWAARLALLDQARSDCARASALLSFESAWGQP